MPFNGVARVQCTYGTMCILRYVNKDIGNVILYNFIFNPSWCVLINTSGNEKASTIRAARIIKNTHED